jgi:hypothetical protein
MIQFKNQLKFGVEDYPLTVEYIFNWSKSPLDSTNQTFMIKLMEDGLVSHGILIDDSVNYVKETRSKTVHNRDLKNDMITIRFLCK